MNDSGIRARLATSNDHEQMVDLCALAFAEVALSKWIHPDPGTRLETLRLMFGMSLHEALENDTVIVASAPDRAPSGVSIWQLSSTLLTHEIPGDDPLSLRMRALQGATDAVRPRTPHVYLPSMAVHPSRQGSGVGWVMLAAGIDRAAARGLPIFLEASSPENRRFYLGHGFRDLGSPIRVADDAPTLQPMWRENAGASVG